MDKLTDTSDPTNQSTLPADLQGDGAPAPVIPPTDHMAEMSFLDHLEELRWTLFKALGGVIAITIVCSFFSEWIIQEVLLGPKKPDFFMYRILGIEFTDFDLQNRTITGQFWAYFGTVFGVGLVMGSPIVVFFIWRFIEPGLYPTEKQGLRFASFFATGFFVLGILFGYCIITPIALQFFATFQISDQILNEFDISRYFSMVTFWAFGTGILFELPVVIYFLAKLGVATPTVLRNGRKYAIIVTLILAAFFTPPDPLSQILVAIPLMLLYEVSIYISAYVTKKREQDLARALS